MTPIVFLDANVLVPYNLMSVLLTMAEDGLFTPRWSQAVLDETSRALVEKLGLPRDGVNRRMWAMTKAFPEAMVTGYEHLEAAVNCDPKDRHVLAGAVAAGADALVTVNLRDSRPTRWTGSRLTCCTQSSSCSRSGPWTLMQSVLPCSATRPDGSAHP